MRLTPELRQFDKAKSMMRNLPPKNTAGLARRSVSCLSRLPRPPASTSASVRRANRSWTRAEDSMGYASDDEVNAIGPARRANPRVKGERGEKLGLQDEARQIG